MTPDHRRQTSERPADPARLRGGGLERSTIALAVAAWSAILGIALDVVEPTTGAWGLAVIAFAALARSEFRVAERTEPAAEPSVEPTAARSDRSLGADESRESEFAVLANELPRCKDEPIMLEEAAARLAAIFDANWVEIVTPDGREAAFESVVTDSVGTSISVPIPSDDERIGHLCIETREEGRPSTRLRDDLQRAALLVADTLERLEIRRLLREAEARVAATKAAKRDFLANTSHEVRTPLNGIVGSAQLLSGTELDETQSDYVDTILRSSDALLDLMSDVLELATLEAGEAAAADEPFDVRECVESVASAARRDAAAGVDVLAECGPGLDSGLDGGLVGAGAHVRRALAHLATNAVEFTESGRVVVSAHALGRADRPGGSVRVRFAVEDTGVGIPNERRDAIFETFSQADGGTTRSHGGAGLGLSIASELVRLMGSTVELESQVGVGSTFAFVLELTRAEDEADVEPSRPAPAASDVDGTRRSDVRVLVVDDNPVNRRVARRLLERRGLSVDVAADGLEAVEQAIDGRFDLVLMDLQMPVMDGVEATEVLLRRWQVEERAPSPIVALTAHATDEHRRRCLDAGMDEFLTKPLREHELDAVLDRYVDARGAAA